MNPGRYQRLAYDHVNLAKRMREEAKRASRATATALRHAARYHDEAALRYADDAKEANHAV